ncbi:MAG: hypothetical protein QM530_10340 [Phycisphaerales bacterium]|nr:hypothetical protein [Phycisphaerales bacterium]
MLHFVYPTLCLGCARSLLQQEEVLCIECAGNLPLTNYHHIADNETAARFVGRIKLKHATSFAYFTKDGLLQKMLHQFKYHNHPKVGLFLAKRFAHLLKKTDWIKEIDLIVPVPLHKKKLDRRGFNQSEIIATEIGRILNIAVDMNLLDRKVNTESQTRKSLVQRLENMDGVFQLKKTSIAHQHILLLDDVLTTGATLESCFRTLQNLELVQISVATIGIAI